MISEYFSITLTDSGNDALLSSLPLILPGHSPDLSKLPLCLSLLSSSEPAALADLELSEK